MKKNISRDQEIIDLFLNGVSQSKIALDFFVSRQRINQVLQKHGLDKKDGGSSSRERKFKENLDIVLKDWLSGLNCSDISKKYKISAKKSQNVLNDNGFFKSFPPPNLPITYYSNECCIAWCGFDLIDWRKIETEYLNNNPILKFYQYQKNMKNMYPNIEFSLIFSEWWNVWNQSQKYSKIGSSKDNYCMTRKNRDIGFIKGNIEIIKISELFQNRNRRLGYNEE